jgi:hypothetical protein
MVRTGTLPRGVSGRVDLNMAAVFRLLKHAQVLSLLRWMLAATVLAVAIYQLRWGLSRVCAFKFGVMTALF